MTRRLYDAIVPAGGAAVRLGGIDKPKVDVGGVALIDRVRDALAGASRIVVVGSDVGGGPAAAVVAGLEQVTAEIVVLLASDMPFVTTVTVQRLVDAVDVDGAVAVGTDGQPQWLLSAWRASSLRAAELKPSGSLRAALQPLSWSAIAVDDVGLTDCDTPEDLRRARELAR
jgi:molybdopterin-guanine dinucleotide biosynthesis protein A